MKKSSGNSPSGQPAGFGPAVLATLFFFSGAIALVYEVVWQRQFALLLGSAAPATAAVLAAFFAGMGVGSLVVGRLADRWPNPLRAYAILEALMACGAAAALLLLPVFEGTYSWLYGHLSGIPGGLFTGRIVIAFGAIAVPTFCMGGTLPVLGKLIDQDRHRLGITAGLLYVANTAGAGVGALSVPFVLLPELGIARTLLLCVLGNFALAAWAWRLSRRKALTTFAPVTERGRSKESRRTRETSPLLPVLALVSGAATFALQVFWNRGFAQVHENSVHAFAVIVATIILALALGAQLARVGLRRGWPPRRLLGVGWIAAGILVTLGPGLFLRMTDGLAYLPVGGEGFSRIGGLLVTVVTILLAPVTLAGMALPAILEEAGRSSALSTSRVLGRILVANIVGSVVGALIAGFAAPRFIPLWAGIIMVGLGLVVAGIATQIELAGRRRPMPLVAACLAVLAVGWLAAVKLPLPRVRIDAGRGEKLVSLEEGTHGITAVVERSGTRRLKLNNHYLLGGTASVGDERMQAHVPLLLHPAPRRVAFLGLGTGITTGGALFHPVERVTAIELVPEVVTAAREFFADSNAGLSADPRVAVVTDDARHFLRGSRQMFDVIVGDLVVPWRPGEGALYTRESFVAARESLAPGGLFCQWVPCFQLSADELRIILRTFLEVFPQAMIWRGDFSPTDSAIGMVGWNGDAAPQPGTIRQRLEQMQRDPANPHLATPAVFWMHYLGSIDREHWPELTGTVNTEDRPVIELRGPLQRIRNQTASLSGRALQRVRADLFAGGAVLGYRLTDDEQAGVRAGALFEEMMLQIAEGNVAGARSNQGQLNTTLPAESYKLLFP